MKAGVGVTLLQARNTKDRRNTEDWQQDTWSQRKQGAVSPTASGGAHPAVAWPQTSGLQNCERRTGVVWVPQAVGLCHGSQRKPVHHSSPDSFCCSVDSSMRRLGSLEIYAPGAVWNYEIKQQYLSRSKLGKYNFINSVKKLFSLCWLAWSKKFCICW